MGIFQINNYSLVFILILILGSHQQSTLHNSSLCTNIQIDGLHYFINKKLNNQDIVDILSNSTTIYNLCQQVQVYCESLNKVINASMVVELNDGTCIAYTQINITYINQTNPTSGIKVLYASLEDKNKSNIIKQYVCNISVSDGCPSVQSGIMWQYFTKNVIVYTIVVQIIGIILMCLGIYIYRGSIVLIGWGTSFIILTMIQSFFIYLRGVPETLIQNVLILTVITSFFVGYLLGYFPKAGVFCMGLWIGFVISLTLNNVCLYLINSNPSNLMLYIVMPVISIGFGILILFIKRTFIIFASSLIGSYLSLRALSWNLGAFPNQFQLSKKYHNGLSEGVTWQFYLYVIALLILTASSSALQTWLFKKKMKKDNQNEDIEQQLDKLENSMKQKREGLIQIKNVFENEKPQTRVLPKQKKIYKRDSLQQVEQNEQIEESLPGYQQSQKMQMSQRQSDIPVKKVKRNNR